MPLPLPYLGDDPQELKRREVIAEMRADPGLLQRFSRIVTPARLRAIRMRVDGYETREIAEALGVNRTSVAKMIQKGLDAILSHGMDWGTWDMSPFFEMYPDGASTREIARYIGVSQTLVQNIQRSAMSKLVDFEWQLSEPDAWAGHVGLTGQLHWDDVI